MNFAEKIIAFNQSLHFNGKLPEGIGIMNPFAENQHALEISSQFYQKYYSDKKSRKIILGINPGRFGAGITGIPFTDTKRLEEKCGLAIPNVTTHELSSVFIYEMIAAYGGPDKFYNSFYINSVSPLGFVKTNTKGKEINYNYYDDASLLKAVEPFMIESLEEQLNFGIDTSTGFCLGTGKNYHYLNKLNKEKHYFDELIPLEHPRYIMQYKLKRKQEYIEKYLQILQ